MKIKKIKFKKKQTNKPGAQQQYPRAQYFMGVDR